MKASKMTKWLCAMTVSGALTIGLLGCSSADTAGKGNEPEEAVAETKTSEPEGTSGTEEPAEGEITGLKIGVAMPNAGDEYRSTWGKYFTEHAKAAGAEVIITDASDDVSKQISDCESLIAQQCDVIIVNPLDTTGIVPALEQIKAADIKCIMLDFYPSEEYSDLYDAFIGFSAEDIGAIQGEAIKNWLEEKDKDLSLGYVVGMYSIVSEMGRRDGVYEVLGVEEPTVEAEANWKAEEAMALAEDWMQAHPDINVYACMSDQMAIGVIQALTAANVDMEEVFVAGIDGLSPGIEYVKKGTLDVTISHDLKADTKSCLTLCEQLMKGEEVEKMNFLPKETLIVLTPENVNEYYPD